MAATARLRPVTEEDLAVLRRFRVDPDALGEFEWRGFVAPGWVERRFHEDGFLGADGRRLIVADGDQSAALGIASWKRMPADGAHGTQCCEIGVALLPEARGRGFGSHAHALLATYLFDTTPTMRLQARTDADNVAEQHALERAGFTREGRSRSAGFRQGQWRDVMVHGRLRTDPGPDR